LESSPFKIEEAYTLEEIQAAAEENRLDSLLNSVELVFMDYKPVTIKQSALSSIMNGNPLFGQGVQQGFDKINADDDVSIYSEEGFIGIGTVKYEEARQRLYIKIKNIFI
jgi:tRNA pseudouridine55 synthase